MTSAVWYYLVLTFESVFGIFGVRLNEEPPYAVIDRPAANVEVRRYPPRLAAEVDGSGTSNPDDQSFRLLFNYIAGANRGASGAAERIAMTVPVDLARPQRIAMTAPVDTGAPDGTSRMRFFLPARYTAQLAPAPTDPRVKIVTVPDETIATLCFTGTGRDLPDRQRQLVEALAASRWKPAGAPYALFYDAPFTIPFLRRNEAAVAVAPR